MVERFLSFDKLIGPSLIKLLYYVGMVVIVIASVVAAFGALFSGFEIVTFFMALLGGALGLVFWRFMCEIYLLFFRISDDLRDMKNHQLGREANEADV